MDGWMDGWKNNVALAHPHLEGKSCSKFGSISPCGLGRDSMAERW